MRARLPPLNALKSFDAAARHGSFTRAAEELCVTQGAVSQQVKALEAELGLKLFNRERQRLSITAAGRDYLAVIGDALDRIAAGTERLRRARNAGTLTVSTSPDFAAKWLVHRLGRFQEAHPDVELRIAAAARHVDFARDDVDVAIRHGDGDWPGLSVVRLCEETLFPVCSPRLAAEAARTGGPADLLKRPLLHVDDQGAWARWHEAAGLPPEPPSRGPVLNSAGMLVDAAVDGLGVALARTTLAAWDLVHGRLVRPFEVGLPLTRGYWIVCPRSTATLPKIAAFRDWMLAEAADDLRRLQALAAAPPAAGEAPQ